MTARRRRRGPSSTLAPCGLVVALALSACAAPDVSRHSLIGDPTPVGGGSPGAASVMFPSSTPRTTTLGAPPTVAPTTSTTAAPRRVRPFGVGTTVLDLADPTRATGTTPGRHLPTLVVYPTAGAPGPRESAGAAGLDGDWPLVVFAHGYDVTPLTYAHLLHHLAQAGFVVAAPSFPLGTAGGPLDENDLVNQPGDLRFVITQTLAASARPGVLAGMVDGTRIAAVGHSDGGEAVLGATLVPASADSRIGPVVAMSAQPPLPGDELFTSAVPHPLLVVQGTQDTINPPSLSDQLFARDPGPKGYLHLLGGDHLSPVADPTPWRPVVETTVVDWLDAWFGGANAVGAAARLSHDGSVDGVARFNLG